MKLVDENETKRAATRLYKIFNSNCVFISEETNILQIGDAQGVEVTSFLYNSQQTTKKLACRSIPKY